MTQRLDSKAPAYFDLRRGSRPVLVEVPHSGLAIPDVVRHELHANLHGLARDSDIYVDKLFAEAPEQGASLLVAHASRYVVDLNRAADDVDPAAVPDHPRPRTTGSRGVVWRMATDGRALLRRPLTHAQLKSRIARFHAPYHSALSAELERMHAAEGYAIVLAAHSMPSVGRGMSSSRMSRRADVVPGTRGGSSADPRLIALITEHFQSAGLSVRLDDPYRGGYTTTKHGRPDDGYHAIQIELNRALYVNEETGEPRRGAFETLQTVLTQLVAQVTALHL